jgi:hypothetical protein
MGADTCFKVNQFRRSKWSSHVIIAMAIVVTQAHAQFPGQFPRPAVAPPTVTVAPLPDGPGITVLFLGDSLSLCGFGKRLDGELRQMPGVKAVFTYMACATQPLSWLKAPPYGNVKTRCGFWSIESTANSAQPEEIEDVYGMRRGWTPRPHPVPKFEDLLAQIRPDVLIIQTGGNLFDLFPDHKTVRPGRDALELRKFVAPFLVKAVSPPSQLKRIYWVASPVSGRVSQQVQDFVVQQVRSYCGPAATVIDSRALISYPYRHMEPDHEHFVGEDMDIWADKISKILQQDLASSAVATLKPLSETFPQFAVVTETTSKSVTTQTPSRNGEVEVLAKLVFKSKSMKVEEFLPYQESLVAFVYDVQRVVSGEYDDAQVLVMHPAYIGLKRQSLRKYRIGRTYKLRLCELEKTPWNTVKRRDDSGRLDLDPYIKLEDEAKYPGSPSAD